MPEHLQFPLGTALIILPILLGGILGMWGQVFVRNVSSEGRTELFLSILLPTIFVGVMGASAGLWHVPSYDEFYLPHDGRRDFQTSLFLAFAASMITIPIASKMTPVFWQTVIRLRERQISLALLVGLVGMAGPLVFFSYSLVHRPEVLLYVGIQYAVFGLILRQFTRPALLEEESPSDV